MKYRFIASVFSLMVGMCFGPQSGSGGDGMQSKKPVTQEDFFPIVLYGHFGINPTLDREVIDNASEGGWNTVNTLNAAIQDHAGKRGMRFSGWCNTLIPQKRNADGPRSLKVCVNSPEYKRVLEEFLTEKRSCYENMSDLWVVTLKDEPCINSGASSSVCHCEYCQETFRARYGVALPEKTPPVSQPVLRRQYVDFYNDYWAMVWKLSRDFMKANKPQMGMAVTFTEMNCLGRHKGRGYGDLLKWSDGLDWIAADIYPYYNHWATGLDNDVEAIDAYTRRSRLLMAFLRCTSRHYGIPFAWWVGCTSSTNETPKAIRHMSYTAIGQGAEGLLGWGAYFPEYDPVIEYNPALWEDAGKTFLEIGKVGPLLRHLKKTSRIALLIPDTEGLFTSAHESHGFGPFYYDLCPVYDALMRAFGNVDLVYERQLPGGKLKDYRALVMANVKHVSSPAAESIKQFVRDGGVVISDNVPEQDENNQPLDTLVKVMGRPESERRGARDADVFPSVFPHDYEKGKTLLLSFRMGRFYDNPVLWELLRSRLQACGVHPHAFSGNPDIESNYLAGDQCFVIIAVNRKREEGTTEVTCFQPSFKPGRVTDLVSGQDLLFKTCKTNDIETVSFPLEVDGISGRIVGVYPEEGGI